VPKILDRLVNRLMENGSSKRAAYAIATSQLQKSGVLKRGTADLTKKGEIRNNMSPAARAMDRRADEREKSPGEYRFNPKNKTAVKGRVNLSVKPRA